MLNKYSYNAFITIVFSIVLVACSGYTPLYSKQNFDSENVEVKSVELNKQQIDYKVGERRVAQLVLTELKKRLFGDESSKYYLTISLSKNTQAVAVRIDAIDERLRLDVNALATLKERTSDKTVLTFTTLQSVSYNVENSPFSTEQGEEAAFESVANVIADEISQRVAWFFAKKNIKQQNDIKNTEEASEIKNNPNSLKAI